MNYVTENESIIKDILLKIASIHNNHLQTQQMLGVSKEFTDGMKWMKIEVLDLIYLELRKQIQGDVPITHTAPTQT